MQPELYVVGGRQKAGTTTDVGEWDCFGTAVVAAVDMGSGAISIRAEHVSPPGTCAKKEPSVLFKTGTLLDGRLYVPTQTELLTYEVPSFDRVGYVSLPCFNDVHHVRPGPDGNLFVANTGLDMVLEVSPDGAVLKEWSVIGEELWTRFARDTDYRKVASTKPHQAHPNNVWFLDDELWVTRCDKGDAHCLTAMRPPVPIADRPIHDGLLHGDSIYFTAVSGVIVQMAADTRQIRRRFDLNALAGGSTPLGWCRGIEMLDEHHAVVGFSRLRPTRWKQNIQWFKHWLGGDGTGLLPTRIALFDLCKERLCWEVDLEPAGMNAIFSIHNAAERRAAPMH